MPAQSELSPLETLPSWGRVHVIGAGPVGLLMTALLQPMDGFSVRLYEKRREYTRTRMVQLASYLVADSVESYCADHIDGESVEAIFDPPELDEGLAFRQSIPPDLMALLRGWTQGFCPLNTIERSLSDLIDARRSHPVQRTTAVVTAEDAMAMLAPGDILIDCTGSKSLLRDQLAPGAGAVDRGANTFNVRLEYALVVTFLYGQAYDCNEYCKYHKNIENPHYKFIPAVHRTYYDGSISHVTGIVNITAEDYERDAAAIRWPVASRQLPRRGPVDGPLHRQDQGGNPRRDHRRPGDRPDPAGSVPGAQRDQPAVAPGGDRRPPVRPLAGVPGRRFGHGLPLLPVDFAGLRVRDVPGGTARAARPAAAETCSIATSCTRTSSGFACTCAAR